MAFKTLAGKDTIFNKKEIIIRNTNKDTLEISGFKNGVLHGEKRLFYNDGKIKLIANYKKGLLHGKVESFTPRTEQISRTEHYLALPEENISVIHGKVIIYYMGGEIQEELNYEKGYKNGKYTVYHSNGEIRERGTFQNDLHIGNKIVYQKNGRLRSNENFIIIENPNYVKIFGENNKEKKSSNLRKEVQNVPKKLSVLDGNAKYYHYNGDLSSDLQFKKGKKDGLCKEYHQDKINSLKSEVEFKDGFEHGSFIRYNQNGQIERQGIYYRLITVDDTLYKNVYDGKITIYNSGKLQRIENWENFMRNGVQEDYSYHTGELTTRTHFKDNLKFGIEERFDAEGLKSYEAHFEIVNLDGRKGSQKTGIETYWNKGKISSKTTWIDGKKEGKTMTYYANGQIEKVMYFKNGELDGKYLTYYENGKLREDYNYHLMYNSRKFIGWNRTYDEQGNLTRIFNALGNDKNSLDLNFEKGNLIDLAIHDAFQLSISNDQNIKSIHLLKHSRPLFGYKTFTNQQLRRIHFVADKHHSNTANFTTNGELNQIYTSTGNSIDEPKINKIAEIIAAQYNPEWNDEKLVKEGFKDGKHQWKYKDGSIFFEMEFKDSLPNGKWISYNPIDGDTLIHAEYKHGLPIGNWVEKSVDGVVKLRISYYPNHQIKENYSFANEEMLREVRKYDSQGKETYYADFYENGNLKSMREPELSNSIYMWDNGDTSNFNILYTDEDSIRIERQFYKGNILKLQRKTNYSTGLGTVETYFENGQLKTSHKMKDGKSNGAYQQFDENGKLLNQGQFKDGKRHGQWIKYDENGLAEISLFDNGEFIIDRSQEDPNACVCYDKSLQSGKIGYAGGLYHFEEFENVKAFIPKKVIPIDDFNYGNIFYLNLQTDNNRDGGYTSMKLLMFKEFAFHYPAVDYLKFNLNPCKTEGYISNIEGSFRYGFNGEGTVYATLITKKIAVTLQNNPLVQINNETPFKVLFDTKGMDFDKNGIKNIQFVNEDSTCYPKGIINNVFEIDILNAKLNFRPYLSGFYNLPLLTKESERFYGLVISKADLSFDFINGSDTTKIEATSNNILAGANYVAARINVEGELINDKSFKPKNSTIPIDIDVLQRFLEEKGFYRVKIEIVEGNMAIEFFTEK